MTLGGRARRRRGPAGPAVALLLGAALVAPAGSTHTPQDHAPRYSGALLSCAVFREQVRSHIRSRRSTTVVEDRAGRDGLLVVRASDSTGAVRVEAWYDSLEVWRETADGTERADTDGFVGGRYVGVVAPAGTYRPVAVPFVPDDLAALANLAGAFDDFLPRLPAAALDPGEDWSDGLGVTFRRLSDRTEARERVQRYRWTIERSDRSRLAADSGEATVERETRETGELSWATRLGPFAWYRKIEVDATVPPRGGVTQPFLSTVTQEVWVTRAPGHPACPEPEAGR